MNLAKHRSQLPSGFSLMVGRMVTLWQSGQRLEAVFVAMLPVLLVLFALIMPGVAALAFVLWVGGNFVGFQRQALRSLQRQYALYASDVLAWVQFCLRRARAALAKRLLRINATAIMVALHSVLDQRSALHSALALIDPNLVFRLTPPAAARA